MEKIYTTEITGRGWMTCKVDGCDTTVRSKWGTLCNTHYFRGRRTGTTAKRPRSKPSLTSHGYMVQNWKGHPAASSKGCLYEHRKVFHEVNGPDGHKCKWCSKDLNWVGTSKDKLHVDHLNGVKHDNRPENLVPSCHSCNYKRGAFMSWISERSDDPVLAAMFESSRS